MPEGPLGFPRLTDLGPFTKNDEGICKLSSDVQELCNSIFQEIYIAPMEHAVNNTPMNHLEGLVNDMERGERVKKEIDRMAQSAIDEAERAGLELVGMGMNRAVFSKSNFTGRRRCVVKIPYFNMEKIEPDPWTEFDSPVYEQNAGLIDQIVEYENWENMRPEIEDLFLPIHDADSDYRWSVSPRAEPDGSLFKEVRQEVNGRGAEVYDLSPQNVGTYDSEPVIIDYGDMVVFAGSPLYERGVGEDEAKRLIDKYAKRLYT